MFSLYANYIIVMLYRQNMLHQSSLIPGNMDKWKSNYLKNYKLNFHFHIFVSFIFFLLIIFAFDWNREWERKKNAIKLELIKINYYWKLNKSLFVFVNWQNIPENQFLCSINLDCEEFKWLLSHIYKWMTPFD